MDREEQLIRLKEMALRAISSWSPKLAEAISARPELLDQLVETGVRALGEELRIALVGISQEAGGPLRELVERLHSELDRQEVIEAIARSLVNPIAAWLQEDGEAKATLMTAIAREFTEAFMQKLDLEEFANEVADRVAEKLGREVQVRISQP